MEKAERSEKFLQTPICKSDGVLLLAGLKVVAVKSCNGEV